MTAPLQVPSRPAESHPHRGARRDAVLVLVIAALAAALGLYEVGDRDLFTAHEARAARVALTMLDAGDWPADRPAPRLVPQYSPDAPAGLNYQKPPLYYWAVAGASAIAGRVDTLTVRLPSVVSLVLLAVIVFYTGKAMAGPRAGFLSALVLISTPKILWWSRAAVLDPMLAACVAGAMLFFFRAHLGVGGRWQYWLFWALAGLGMLVKATSLVVPLMAVGVYLLVRARDDGFWRPLWRMRPVSGMLVLLAVAAPWHIAADVATGGRLAWAGGWLPEWRFGDFSRIYWGIHVFGRTTGTSVFEKTTSWWYYLTVMPRDFAPWVVFLPGALVQPWREASRQDRGRVLMPCVWLVATFIFFSAISFHKDEYMLVAYPAAALLVGYMLDTYVQGRGEDRALGRWIEVALCGLAAGAVALGAGLIALAHLPAAREALLGYLENRTDRAAVEALTRLLQARAWTVPLLVLPMMAGTVAAIVLVRRRRPGPAVGLVAAAAILAFIVFVDIIVPVLGPARGLSSFAAAIEAEAERRGPAPCVFLAVGECHELAFLLRGYVRELDAQPQFVPAMKKELAGGRPWLVVMDRKSHTRGLWADAELAWNVVAETPPNHHRPMVCLEPGLLAGRPDTKRENQ